MHEGEPSVNRKDLVIQLAERLPCCTQASEVSVVMMDLAPF